jgi:PAS domain S-box-containing protein
MILDDMEQRKAMLAAIIDSSEDAIISKDLNSVVTSWNHSAERMFGYTEKEMIGKHISILIPEDRIQEEEMIISQLKEGKRIEHFETIRITKTGILLNISLTISPIRNAKGVIVGASKIARDITKQKENEEVIKQYANRLEVINSVGKTITAQLDIDSILQKVTDATTELSGAAFGAFFYNKTDVKGNTYMLYALSGALRETFEKFGMPRNTEVFKLTFSGEAIVRSDDITKDPRYGKNLPHHGMPKGHLPVISYLAVPVVSQTGIVIGGLFFGHPEPAMFKAEHEHLVGAIAIQASIALDNAKLYEEINALNSKKDEFIGFASHELKTPLTTISGYLQLAKEAPLPTGFMDKIEKQVTRLQALIDDLLDISKIQAGKLDLNSQKTSLNAMISEILDTFEAADHKIETELPAEDIMVTVDIQKISQVIINILSNAVKYSQPGTPIYITVIRLGDQIKISIKDEGMGIPPQHLDKIFNQFYRIARSSNTRGMGLGLYIAKEIIDAHVGKIWAESGGGKGSVFYILLPIERMRPRN